jgi:hypothetical protein
MRTFPGSPLQCVSRFSPSTSTSSVLRGEEFDWYPYQNEPWHWEYNPPGFREIFWADFPGGAPQRAIMVDEP